MLRVLTVAATLAAAHGFGMANTYGECNAKDLAAIGKVNTEAKANSIFDGSTLSPKCLECFGKHDKDREAFERSFKGANPPLVDLMRMYMSKCGAKGAYTYKPGKGQLEDNTSGNTTVTYTNDDPNDPSSTSGGTLPGDGGGGGGGGGGAKDAVGCSAADVADIKSKRNLPDDANNVFSTISDPCRKCFDVHEQAYIDAHQQSTIAQQSMGYLQWCAKGGGGGASAGGAGGNLDNQPGGCQDSPGFKDQYGGCEKYAQQGWCSPDGVPGPGWKPSWGPLSPKVVSSCCECGKGGGGGGSSSSDGSVDPSSN